MEFKAKDWSGNEIHGHAIMNEGIYTYLVTENGQTLIDANSVEAIEESEN